MLLRLLTAGSLGIAALAPAAARADHDRDDPFRFAIDLIAEFGRHHGDACACSECAAQQRGRVWVEGHHETREVRRRLPAVTRQEWVPDRCEEVCVPAVTERVCVPAVTQRVWCPPVTETCWVPELRERVFVPGHSETRRDSLGCLCRVWIAGHYEDRVVRPGRYEERVVRPGRYEERVVTPQRWETRVVTPERREVRVVERGHYRTVVVRPERHEVCLEKVWVPGRWESRKQQTAGWRF